jgi:hypothetical protein
MNINWPLFSLAETLNTMTGLNEVGLSILNEAKPHVNAILERTLGALFSKGWMLLEQI